jgi:tRNA pseudouridine65 synthase
VILKILYQDSDYIFVSKPAGLLVHRTNLDSAESQAAVQILRDQIGQRVFPVHRLDKPTSGILAFALSSSAAKLFSEELSAKRVQKKYLTIVRGLSPQNIKIDYPLKEELDSISDKKARVDKDKQEAVTIVETLASVELPVAVDRYPTSRYSLVRATPLTGRKHQIRRHLKHLGHPVIGDVNHGVGKHNRFFREYFQCSRLLLACTEMSFQHPRTKEQISIKADLCEDFFQVVKQLGWESHV